MSGTKTSRPNVASFIKKGREAGKSDDLIRSDLLEAGWQIDVINHALNRPIEPAKTDKTPSHFTKYSDWYTEKRFVYFAIALVVTIILLTLFI